MECAEAVEDGGEGVVKYRGKSAIKGYAIQGSGVVGVSIWDWELVGDRDNAQSARSF